MSCQRRVSLIVEYGLVNREIWWNFNLKKSLIKNWISNLIRLAFISATKAEEFQMNSIVKNLDNIQTYFPEYSEKNTICISPLPNLYSQFVN